MTQSMSLCRHRRMMLIEARKRERKRKKTDKSNFTLGELASTEFLETLSELLEGNTLSTNLGEMKTKRVRFLCDNKNPCKIAHTT